MYEYSTFINEYCFAYVHCWGDWNLIFGRIPTYLTALAAVRVKAPLFTVLSTVALKFRIWTWGREKLLYPDGESFEC